MVLFWPGGVFLADFIREILIYSLRWGVDASPEIRCSAAFFFLLRNLQGSEMKSKVRWGISGL